jgi:hypothetical protein
MMASTSKTSTSTHQLLLLLLLTCVTPSTSFTLFIHKPPPISTTLSSTAYGYEQPINIEENAYRDIDALQNWAYNYGIQQCESFTLASSQPEYGQADIYAATVDEIPTGTTVLYVPEELILSSSKAMNELRGPEMLPAEKVLSSINADSELRHYYLMIKVRS